MDTIGDLRKCIEGLPDDHQPGLGFIGFDMTGINKVGIQFRMVFQDGEPAGLRIFITNITRTLPEEN